MENINRRIFLKRAAQGAVVASFSSVLAGYSPHYLSGSKMQIGLVTYQWGKDMDLPTLISSCEKSGVLGVELRTTHKHGVERSLSKAQRADVKKRFADSNVLCLGIGSNEDFHDEDPAELKKSINAAKEFIKLSHDVGGSGVKVKPNKLLKEVPQDKTIAQIGRSLNELGAFGANYGQEIRLEVHGKQTSELPIMKKIMDVADHKNVGVCWNCNKQDLEGKGLEHNFNLVKGRFGRTVHVREINTDQYPYPELIELFVKMDYAGWILLECRGKVDDKIKAMIEQRELLQKLIKSD